MASQIPPNLPSILAPTASALVAYSIGWWWGRRRLRATIAGHLADLHDLQANGIHSATYWKLNGLK